MILENKSNDKTLKITEKLQESLQEQIEDYLESDCEVEEWVTVDDMEFYYRGQEYYVSFTGIARGYYESDTAYYDGSHYSTGYQTKVITSTEFQDVEICRKEEDQWFQVW